MFTGMWLSTLIVFPVGIWLSYMAGTDSAIMSTETYTKILNKIGIGNWFKK